MPEFQPERFIPLTPVTFHILLSLHRGVKHGYGIKREVEERTGGILRLGAGTLYAAIQRLNHSGLVAETAGRETPGEATNRWRFYELTSLGRTVLLAELERLETDLDLAYAAGLSTSRRNSS